MDSLIGTVPDGWTQVELGDIFYIQAGPSGTRLTLKARTSSSVPVVAPRDLRNNRIADDGRVAVALDAANELGRYRLSPGDVVCSRTGELGRHALTTKEQDGWLVGSSCLRLRSRGSISGSYLVYYLGHPALRDWIIRNATGSAIPSVNTKTLGSIPVVLPTAAAQSVVADILGALDEKIAVHDQICKTTAALRDSVLPLLLTGAGVAEISGHSDGRSAG